MTVAALAVDAEGASGMGILHFDTRGAIQQFEEKPSPERLAAIGRSAPPGSTFMPEDERRPFVASMGIYVFTREVLFDLLARESGVDFGRELIPAALDRYRVVAHLHDSYWADVGTVESFYHANIMLTQPGAPFSFYDPKRPIYTHARFLSPSSVDDARLVRALVAEGCDIANAEIEDSVVGIRTAVGPGARIRRSVLLGADFYDTPPRPGTRQVPLGIGPDVELDRVIVDKNARIGDGRAAGEHRGRARRRRAQLLHPRGHPRRPQGGDHRPGYRRLDRSTRGDAVQPERQPKGQAGTNRASPLRACSANRPTCVMRYRFVPSAGARWNLSTTAPTPRCAFASTVIRALPYPVTPGRWRRASTS